MTAKVLATSSMCTRSSPRRAKVVGMIVMGQVPGFIYSACAASRFSKPSINLAEPGAASREGAGFRRAAFREQVPEAPA